MDAATKAGIMLAVTQALGGEIDDGLAVRRIAHIVEPELAQMLDRIADTQGGKPTPMQVMTIVNFMRGYRRALAPAAAPDTAEAGA